MSRKFTYTLICICLVRSITAEFVGRNNSLPLSRSSQCNRDSDIIFNFEGTSISLKENTIHIPAIIQPRPTSTKKPITPAPYKHQPDSPIGYEFPCGRKGFGNKYKIVGGTRAKPGEFPWQVSLQLKSEWSTRHICGGAIISKYWIVTAAHCISGLPPVAFSVVAGDHDLYRVEGHEQRVGVVRILTRGYVKTNFSNDIALLQLDRPLKMDGVWIAPVCLPEPHHKFLPGRAIITGWGRLTENGQLPHVLHKVSLPLIAKARCRQFYGNIGFVQFLNRCQICSGWEQGGFDSCQGDSGGPMVCKRSDGYYYLCGIVSWGIGCARPMLPGVYTQVTCFSSWIRDVLYTRSEQFLLTYSDFT